MVLWANKVQGDASFTLPELTDQGLSISYSSSDPTVASISGNTVTIGDGGLVTITASQAGNVNIAAATSVMQSLTVDTLYIWNGTAWNNGVPPAAGNKNVKVSGNYDGMSFASNHLTIESGVNVKITPGSFGNLVVKGDIVNDGFVGLPSAVSLVNYGTITGSGTFGIERATSHSKATGKYSFVGSPITDGKVDSLGRLVYEYDETVPFDFGGGGRTQQLQTCSGWINDGRSGLCFGLYWHRYLRRST